MPCKPTVETDARTLHGVIDGDSDRRHDRGLIVRPFAGRAPNQQFAAAGRRGFALVLCRRSLGQHMATPTDLKDHGGLEWPTNDDAGTFSAHAGRVEPRTMVVRRDVSRRKISWACVRDGIVLSQRAG